MSQENRGTGYQVQVCAHACLSCAHAWLESPPLYIILWYSRLLPVFEFSLFSCFKVAIENLIFIDIFYTELSLQVAHSF